MFVFLRLCLPSILKRTPRFKSSFAIIPLIAGSGIQILPIQIAMAAKEWY